MTSNQLRKGYKPTFVRTSDEKAHYVTIHGSISPDMIVGLRHGDVVINFNSKSNINKDFSRNVVIGAYVDIGNLDLPDRDITKNYLYKISNQMHHPAIIESIEDPEQFYALQSYDATSAISIPITDEEKLRRLSGGRLPLASYTVYWNPCLKQYFIYLTNTDGRDYIIKYSQNTPDGYFIQN